MFEDDDPVVILEVLKIRDNVADNTCSFQADPFFCCIHEANAYKDILAISQDTVNSYGYRERLTLKFRPTAQGSTWTSSAASTTGSPWTYCRVCTKPVLPISRVRGSSVSATVESSFTAESQ